MKNLFTLFICCMIAGYAHSQAYINEIHYDNAGGDVNEMVEVFIADPQPGDLSMYSIELINQAGTVYNTTTLDNFIAVGGVGGTYYYFIYPSNGLQNGGSDGLALCGPAGLIEVLSYEGTTTASSGCAMGVLSTDIGAAESGTAAVGTSIQRQSDGSWVAGLTATPGAENLAPLAVDLYSFDVVKANANAATISWTTAAEENSSHFEILTSNNGQRFEIAAKVEAKGYSYDVAEYEYLDENLSRGMHYYQLKQVNLDGSYTMFDVKSISVELAGITIFPTRVNSKLTVVGADEGAAFEIFNAMGQLVLNGQLLSNEIDLSALASGSYFIRTGEETLPFIK